MKDIRNLKEKEEALKQIIKFVKEKGEMYPIEYKEIKIHCGGETAIRIFRLLYHYRYFYKITTGVYSIDKEIPADLTIKKLLKHE